jgi:hypothetical protein
LSQIIEGYRAKVHIFSESEVKKTCQAEASVCLYVFLQH